MPQPQIPLPLAFDRSAPPGFFVGECNFVAMKTVLSWPNWPSPFIYLCGPPASGKTRLAETWAGMAEARLIDAAKLETIGPDESALAIDSLERLRDEEALFHISNAVALRGGSLLLVARAPPTALDIRLADLKTRLRGATLAEIGPPDQLFLQELLIRLAEQTQLALDPAVAAYCAARMERSHQAAVNLMAALDRRSLAAGRRLTAKLAAEILDELAAS